MADRPVAVRFDLDLSAAGADLDLEPDDEPEPAREPALERSPAVSQFEHKRLDAYKVSVGFAIDIDPVCNALPPGRGYLADQLRRAVASIPLNVAEGSGEFSPRDKARFYRIARRSATESAAIIDLLAGFEAVEPAVAQGAEFTLGRIVVMLTAMIRKLDPASGARAGSRSGSRSRSAPAALRSRSDPAE